MSRALAISSLYQDLPHDVQNSAIAMYADETSLFYRSDDIHQINEAMKKTLILSLKG